MWAKRRWLVLYVFTILEMKNVSTNPVSPFNDSLREYSVNADDFNATIVKTLQKDETGRYAGFAPVQNPVKYKEVTDNALSSSSYSRGLLHHDHGGYGLHNYEEHYPGFIPDYADNFDHHHHGLYAGHHHVGYGHHHKHYDHGLATKALLWPIAGIALLGAAAALVTNPVLLQLGVISGRRRRRDTDDVSSEVNLKTLKSWSRHGDENIQTLVPASKRVTKKMLQNVKKYKKKATPLKGKQSQIENIAMDDERKYNDAKDEKFYVPIPLKLRTN